MVEQMLSVFLVLVKVIANGRAVWSHCSPYLSQKYLQGLPWWSSGYDSMLPLQGVRVRSLGGEVLHATMCGKKKKKKKKKIFKRWLLSTHKHFAISPLECNC